MQYSGSHTRIMSSTKFMREITKIMWNKKKILLGFPIFLWLCYFVVLQRKYMPQSPSITIDNDKYFTLKSREQNRLIPLQIMSGSIHYFRVPPEYWYDRLIKLKAMGLNTVDTYVPWNLHEPTKGTFNFEGILNIQRFLKLANKLGLYIILRPGPYICAEWDWGGLPGWLLSESDMKIRESHEPYLKHVQDFFNMFIPLILPHQYNEGGGIIMVQIENEYGSYARDNAYVVWLGQYLKSAGVTEILFTSDGFSDGRFKMGNAGEGILAVVNDRDRIREALEALREFQPGMPVMLGEYWTGWFDHWGKRHQTTKTGKAVESVKYALKNSASLNMYMFHGGTTFGFLNGANHVGNGIIKYDTSSYDYDAPLSESGHLTSKFYALQKLFRAIRCEGCAQPFSDEETQEVVNNGPSAIKYAQLKATAYVTLVEAMRLIIPWSINKLVPMERICNNLLDVDLLESQGVISQNNTCQPQTLGFIAYRTQIASSVNLISLDIVFADRLILLVNGIEKLVLEPQKIGQVVVEKITVESGRPKDLVILVENMGRVNYDHYPDQIMNTQFKGIIRGTISAGNKPIETWQVYSLDMSEKFMTELLNENNTQLWRVATEETLKNIKQPIFLSFELKRDKVKKSHELDLVYDTFLKPNMTFQKGQAFINAFNLGRYWNIGPTKTSFVPGPRIMETVNYRQNPQFVLFELHKPNMFVELVDKPILG